MIETKYLSIDGLQDKKEIAANIADSFGSLTYEDEFLDTDDAVAVDDFLIYHSDRLDQWIKYGLVFQIDVEQMDESIDLSKPILPLTLQLFQKCIDKTPEKYRLKIIDLLEHNDLVSTIKLNCENSDYDENEYILIPFYENEAFNFFVSNGEDLLNAKPESLEGIKSIIKEDFESEREELDTKIDLQIVSLENSNELDVLIFNYVGMGFPKQNEFLKVNDMYHYTNGGMIHHRDFSINEIEDDIDLLTLLKRDSVMIELKSEIKPERIDEEVKKRTKNRP